jgi:hypothetical protein
VKLDMAFCVNTLRIYCGIDKKNSEYNNFKKNTFNNPYGFEILDKTEMACREISESLGKYINDIDGENTQLVQRCLQ